MPIIPWMNPNAIIKSGTVVFGPTLTTPLPYLGPEIKEKIYRGINTGGDPATAMATEAGSTMITEAGDTMVTE